MEGITAKKKKKQQLREKEKSHGIYNKMENSEHQSLSDESFTVEFSLEEFFPSVKKKKKKGKKKEREGADELVGEEHSSKTLTGANSASPLSGISPKRKHLETSGADEDIVEPSQPDVDGRESGLQKFSKMITASFDASSLHSEPQEQDSRKAKKLKKKRKHSESLNTSNGQTSSEQESRLETTAENVSESSPEKKKKKKKKEKRSRKKPDLEEASWGQDTDIDSPVQEPSPSKKKTPGQTVASPREVKHRHFSESSNWNSDLLDSPESSAKDSILLHRKNRSSSKSPQKNASFSDRKTDSTTSPGTSAGHVESSGAKKKNGKRKLGKPVNLWGAEEEVSENSHSGSNSVGRQEPAMENTENMDPRHGSEAVTVCTTDSSISLGSDIRNLHSTAETIGEYPSLPGTNAKQKAKGMNAKPVFHQDREEAQSNGAVAQKKKLKLKLNREDKDSQHVPLQKKKSTSGRSAGKVICQSEKNSAAIRSKYKSAEFIESDDFSSNESTQNPSDMLEMDNNRRDRPEDEFDLRNSRQLAEEVRWMGKQCYICEEVVNGKSHYVKHLTENHDKRSYQCKKCLRSMATQEQVDHHMMVTCKFKGQPDMLAPYRCQLCPMTYTQLSSCQRHKAREHQYPTQHPDEAKKNKCWYCEQEFSRSDNLRLHIAKCSQGLLPPRLRRSDNECSECGKMYASKQSRSYHMRTIHRHERFICGCGRKFLGSSHYYKHKKTCRDMA